MASPTPKPAALRQRRNRAPTAATLATKGPQKRLPALPRRPEGQEWHPKVLAWWRDVRRSPMAAEFVESDRHGLFLLADLIDRYWKTGSLEVAKEIRLQGALFGLTPIDRRRLQWEMHPPQAEGLRAVEAPKPAASTVDPREMLRVLS